LKILQANSFRRISKKMHLNQKKALDTAIKKIMENPEANPLKSGDLSGLRVYKYSVHGSQVLLGYVYCKQAQIINLVSVGSHENFYRDLKR